MADEKIVLKIFQPKIEIYETLNVVVASQKWRWKIKAFNGEEIAASTEGYTNRQDCINNIFAVEQSIKYLREKEL